MITCFGASTGINAGEGSIYVGAFAGQNNTSGGNIGIGILALSGGGSGGPDQNIAIGENTGANCSGSQNILMGFDTGSALDPTSNGNIFLGYQCAVNATAPIDSIGIGYQCLNSNILQGFGNIVIGSFSGPSLTTGTLNTIVGTDVGESFTTQSNNSCFGANSALFATTDNSNFFGMSSGNMTTGSDNCFFGTNSGAGGAPNACSQSVMVGNLSGFANTTGTQLTCVGWSSGVTNLAGNNNTYLGWQSGFGNDNGSNNTFIGSNTTPNIGNLNHASAIGADAQVLNSNTIQVGQDTVDNVSIGKNVLINSPFGIEYAGIISVTGSTPLNLDTKVGTVSFTGNASIAALGNVNLILNNALVTATTKASVNWQGGTFALGSIPLINKITYGAGSITINLVNASSTTATGAAGVFNFTFDLLQLI